MPPPMIAGVVSRRTPALQLTRASWPMVGRAGHATRALGPHAQGARAQRASAVPYRAGFFDLQRRARAAGLQPGALPAASGGAADPI